MAENSRLAILKIADRLAEQIEYDYDAAVEKCRKKQEKREQEGKNDIGEDALTLVANRIK